MEVALVCVGPRARWQLPKGLVEADESPAVTAVREVLEEAGIQTTVVAPLEVIEYWYVGADERGERARFHKLVHMFLLEYQHGNVADHDSEVTEARWVDARHAEAMLAFESEREVMRKARRSLKRDRVARRRSEIGAR